MKTSLLWSTAMLLTTFMSIAVNFSQKKTMSSNESWGQFECGFNVMNPSHLPFSFQFFLVALLFLIFDIEIALILAYPMEMNTTKSCLNIFLFVSLLTIGLFYEWQKGKIKWSE